MENQTVPGVECRGMRMGTVHTPSVGVPDVRWAPENGTDTSRSANRITTAAFPRGTALPGGTAALAVNTACATWSSPVTSTVPGVTVKEVIFGPWCSQPGA